MINMLERYKYIIFWVIVGLFLFLRPDIGLNSLKISIDNLTQILFILPPIFILLGLLDVWVQRDTMIKFMGEKSGLLGIFIAFFLGSAAAGPLYVAFPIAGVLLNKGGKFSNILIFLGAWSTTKMPMLLFEASSMGWQFMFARFLINIPVIILIAYLVEKMISPKEKEFICESVRAMK